ncbi:MAG: hypothetical protein JWO86_8996 [Myxococcaceae bacterium]|nr:hypothetical protein [Myxococcaceae bacterium]
MDAPPELDGVRVDRRRQDIELHSPTGIVTFASRRKAFIFELQAAA